MIDLGVGEEVGHVLGIVLAVEHTLVPVLGARRKAVVPVPVLGIAVGVAVGTEDVESGNDQAALHIPKVLIDQDLGVIAGQRNDQKLAQKLAQKADRKVDQKLGLKVDRIIGQNLGQKVARKVDQKLDRKVAQLQGTHPD